MEKIRQRMIKTHSHKERNRQTEVSELRKKMTDRVK